MPNTHHILTGDGAPPRRSAAARHAHLEIDAAGSIMSISESARSILGYGPVARIEPNFFAHIHGRNLLQVMRDVASMICHDRASASWLLRMRNAQGAWIWVRLTAKRNGASGTTADSIAVNMDRLSA